MTHRLRRLAPVLGLLLALPCASRATDCTTNPLQPAQLDLVIKPSGSDIDLGWKRKYHNFGVPVGSGMHLCLANCDQTVDPICDIQGTPSGVDVAGDSLGPPIPAIIDGNDACIIVRFANPGITGTVDLDTGDMNVTASFAGEVQLAKCPTCDGASGVGMAGTCTGGTTNGGACTVDQRIVLSKNAMGDTVLEVSKDCIPAAGGFSVSLTTVNLTSGTQNLTNGSCNGQAGTSDCSGTCSVSCNAGTAPHGGIAQMCCSNNANHNCFPSTITRTGAALSLAAPSAWGDASYPKTGDTTLAGAFCAPSAGVLANLAAGLPGPVTMLMPFTASVEIGDPTTTTTTTSTTSTTTTTQPCTTASCLIDDAKSNPPCMGTALDPSLQSAITSGLGKAQNFVNQAAGASAKKKAKLLKKAAAAIKAFQKKADKLAKRKKNPLATPCRDEIDALAAQIRNAISGM